jgi:putative ABC transport system substrate-binding protein
MSKMHISIPSIESPARRACLARTVAAAASMAMPMLAVAAPARLCWLGTIRTAGGEPYEKAFEQRLRELGLVEGTTLVVARAGALGKLDALPELAQRLLQGGCDIFFGGGAPAALDAMRRAAPYVPVVFVAVDFDPIGTGHVASLARPGGHTTGVNAAHGELPAKRLELLKELLPRMQRVAVLANDGTAGQLEVAQRAAPSLGLQLQVENLRRPPFDFDAAFTRMQRGGAQALLVLGSALWVPHRQLLPALAVKAGLPAMFHQSQWAQTGGLMSYGFNFVSMWQRGAEMVAKVLAGADPATMPMEQPTRYELAINLKVAHALKLDVPRSLLLRADITLDT